MSFSPWISFFRTCNLDLTLPAGDFILSNLVLSLQPFKHCHNSVFLFLLIFLHIRWAWMGSERKNLNCKFSGSTFQLLFPPPFCFSVFPPEVSCRPLASPVPQPSQARLETITRLKLLQLGLIYTICNRSGMKGHFFTGWEYLGYFVSIYMEFG